MRAGSGLTNNGARQEQSTHRLGMAERSKTSSGAFYLWSSAARARRLSFPRRARRRRLVNLASGM